jgi:hypothetical protein
MEAKHILKTIREKQFNVFTTAMSRILSNWELDSTGTTGDDGDADVGQVLLRDPELLHDAGGGGAAGDDDDGDIEARRGGYSLLWVIIISRQRQS